MYLTYFKLLNSDKRYYCFAMQVCRGGSGRVDALLFPGLSKITHMKSRNHEFWGAGQANFQSHFNPFFALMVSILPSSISH